MSQSTFNRQSEQISQASSQQPQVAAIIRPLATVEGTDQSARIDASQPLRSPHRRPLQLESYVSWLQQRSLQDLNEDITQQGAKEKETAPKQATPIQTAAHQGNRKSPSENDASQNGGWSFIRIPREDQLFASSNSKPTSKTNSNASVNPTVAKRPPAVHIANSENERFESVKFRNDAAHPDRQTRPAPHHQTNTSSIQFDSDLKRILEKLDEVAKNSDQLEVFTQVPASNAAAQIQQNQQRQVNTRKVQPAEFAQPYQVELTEAGSNRGPHGQRQGESQKTREFGKPIEASPIGLDASSVQPAAIKKDSSLNQMEVIQAVSKAIASVLTEQNENLIELKIKERLNHLHLDKQSSTPQTDPAVPQTDRVSVSQSYISTSPQALESPPVQVADEIQNNEGEGMPAIQLDKDSDIPSEVAAWDVPDFRWPEISNQMISIGASAIEALGNAMLQSIRETAHRRVGITACERSAGTTAIAISLARWAAGKGLRVLLVDADLENPAMTKMLGLGNDINWMSVPEFGKPLDLASEKIIRSQSSKVCLMPLAISQRKNLAARLRYQHLVKLTEQVLDRFDLILLDFGPGEQILSELIQGNQLIDSTILVHQKKSNELLQLQDHLTQIGIAKFVLAQNSPQPASQTRAA